MQSANYKGGCNPQPRIQVYVFAVLFAQAVSDYRSDPDACLLPNLAGFSQDLSCSHKFGRGAISIYIPVKWIELVGFTFVKVAPHLAEIRLLLLNLS